MTKLPPRESTGRRSVRTRAASSPFGTSGTRARLRRRRGDQRRTARHSGREPEPSSTPVRIGVRLHRRAADGRTEASSMDAPSGPVPVTRSSVRRRAPRAHCRTVPRTRVDSTPRERPAEPLAASSSASFETDSEMRGSRRRARRALAGGERNPASSMIPSTVTPSAAAARRRKFHRSGAGRAATTDRDAPRRCAPRSSTESCGLQRRDGSSAAPRKSCRTGRSGAPATPISAWPTAKPSRQRPCRSSSTSEQLATTYLAPGSRGSWPGGVRRNEVAVAKSADTAPFARRRRRRPRTFFGRGPAAGST